MEKEDDSVIDIAVIDSKTNVAEYTFKKLSAFILSQENPQLPTEADVKAFRDELLRATVE